MNFATLLILAVAATLTAGKPVTESTSTPIADTTTITLDQADASTELPVQPPQPPIISPVVEDILIVPEEAPLVRVLEELPLEDLPLEEVAAAEEEVPEEAEMLLVRPLLPEGHRHARCRFIRASERRYTPSRRRQGYYQRPYYVSYRPFRPRPAYLRPVQEEQPLQIVY